MPERITIGTLAVKNHQFEEGLRKDPDAFRAFLDTMANYHKYPLESQESLHQAGITGRVPLATPAQWQQFFDRTIKEGVVGIPVLHQVDFFHKELRIVYPLSATEQAESSKPAREPVLWQYDKDRDAAVLDGILPGKADLAERIRIRVLERLPENSGNPEVIAAATAHIVLHRLDIPDTYAISSRDLRQIPMHRVLELAHKEAYELLEAIGKGIQAQRQQETVQEQETARTRTAMPAEEEGLETPDALGIDPGTLEEEMPENTAEEREEEEEFLTPEDNGIDPDEQAALEAAVQQEQELQQAVQDEQEQAIHLSAGTPFTFAIQPGWTEEDTIDTAISQIERLTLGYQDGEGNAFPYEQAIHTIWQTVCRESGYQPENLERVTDAQEIAIHTIFTLEAMRTEAAEKDTAILTGRESEEHTPEDSPVPEEEEQTPAQDASDTLSTVTPAEEPEPPAVPAQEKEASASMDGSIRAWYQEAYPDLDDYAHIADISFQKLLDAMNKGYDAYAVMGQGIDSLIREHIFEELSKRSSLPYRDIYNLWLNGTHPYPEESIRSWYHHRKNPMDETVNQMNEMTFQELLTHLQEGYDAYSLIGVNDSHIREIFLQEVARRFDVSVDAFLEPGRKLWGEETVSDKEDPEKTVEALFQKLFDAKRPAVPSIDELTKDDSIRAWYMQQYPEDTAGSHIPNGLTFGQLHIQLEMGRGIDAVIPNLGTDPVIRTRILSGVSIVMGDDAQALQDAISQNARVESGAYHPPIEPVEAGDPALLDFSIPGTRTKAFEQCKEAVMVLCALQREHRNPTEEERKTLKNYPGFTGIAPKLFSPDYSQDPQWKERGSVMQALLREAGLPVPVEEDPLWPKDDAFEPDPALLRGIYRGLREAGFSGGRILNLHAGTGRYYDIMPGDMKEKSQFVAVNDDPVARRIFSVLHLDLMQSQKDLRDTRLPENAFDLAIGRVSYQTAEPQLAEDVKAIAGTRVSPQAYELQKLIQSVRPNGLVVAIVNRSFLQEMNNPDHQAVGRYADLAGAFHLPMEATRNSALPNANNYQDYDVVIFKKRENVRDWMSDASAPEDWLQKAFNPYFELNPYYSSHPDHVLGIQSQRKEQGTFDKNPEAVYFTDYEHGPVSQRLEEGIKKLGPFYTPGKTQDTPLDLSSFQPASSTDQPYGYLEKDGHLIYRTADGEERPLSYSAQDQTHILAILPVRDAAERLLKAEQESCSDVTMKNLQQDLTQAYDTYRKAYGPILGDSVIEKKFCASDRTSRLLLSLENRRGNKAEKSAIFSERVLRPDSVEHHTDSISRALELSLANRGYYDLAYCAELTGRTKEDLEQNLPSSVCFDYAQGRYVPKDEYLSGNLHEKLAFLHDYEQHLRDENFYRTQRALYPLRTFPPFVPKNAEEGRIVQAAGHLQLEDYPILFQNEALLARYLHEDITLLLPVIETAKKTDTPEAREFVKKADDPAFYFRLLQQGMEFCDSSIGVQKGLPRSCLDMMSFLTSTVPLYGLDSRMTRVAPEEELYPERNRVMHLKFSERDGALQAYLEESLKKGIVKGWAHQRASREERDRIDAAWEQFNQDVTNQVLAAEKTIPDPYVQKNLACMESVQKNRSLLQQELARHTVPMQDIAVDISSPWVPHEVIEAFLREAYHFPTGVRPLTVTYDPADAKYRLGFPYKRAYFDRNAKMSESLLFTERTEPSEIVEAALNHKILQVKDTVEEDGKRKKVVNYKESFLAQQKVEALRKSFQEWAKTSETEVERSGKKYLPRDLLAACYNKTFTGIVPRRYDGSHLPFTGMNPQISLLPHQKDAVARILYGGNTLLAHSVGAGKTFEMAASLMEAKRLGLAHKGVMAMPRHLTGSFAEEFRRLYPSARLLVAGDDDFSPQKKQAFLQRMKHGDYDAIILNYEQLESIPLSRKGKYEILSKEMQDTRLQMNRTEGAGKQGYEKQYDEEERERRNLPNDTDELRGLHFDELGIDRLYVDEAQHYKNLKTKTRMQDLSGVSTTGAGKTDDLLAKCQYLNLRTNGKGIVFATGTPISNSVTELYTLQRYLQEDTLKQLGLAHFDAWASTFGQQNAQMNLGQDGKTLKQRMHFSAFTNVPELLSIFNQVADIRTADMLQLDTPEEKMHYVVAEPSATQKEGIEVLGNRAQEIYDGHPMIRKARTDGSLYPDNMLSVTTDGRLLALDPRLIDPAYPDNPKSKVNQCVQNVARIFEATKKEKGTQLIFCDTGTPDKKKAKEFCLYDDIREKLVQAGVPKDKIAFVHDAANDKQKRALFQNVRDGKIRILLGSTEKLGVGTNVQDRVTTIHDLDVPWRPSDLAQRKGRGVRQGNQNESVDIYRYITQNTFDAYLWQINENKQRFLSQVMTSRTPSRTMEDIDSAVLTCAEAKALAVGDSKLKDAMLLQNETMRLALERDAYLSLQDRMEENLRSYYPEELENLQRTKKHLKADYATIQHSRDKTITITGKSFPEENFPELLHLMQQRIGGKVITGTYRGIPISCHKETNGTLSVKFSFEEPRVLTFASGCRKATIQKRIESLSQDILDAISQSEIQYADLKKQRERDQKLCGKPFPKEEMYLEKRARLQRYDTLLKPKKDSPADEAARRTSLILSPQDGTFTPCERYFLAYARSYMEQNGEWGRRADELAVQALKKKHFHPSHIFDAIEKFSPSVPSVQELRDAFQSPQLSRT